MVSGSIIETVKDAIAVGTTILESAEREIAWLVPAPMLVMAVQYTFVEKSKAAIEKGAHVRGITTISSPYLATVRQLLAIGEEVRDVQNYTGAFMYVADRCRSVSAINVDVQDLSLDDSIVAFWTEDPDYAKYLLSSFEMVWDEATDAHKRIEEL